MPIFVFLLPMIMASQGVPSTQSRAINPSAPTDLPSQRPNKHNSKRQFGSWILDVHRDPFADEVACSVSAPGMMFTRGVLTIRFHSNANTFEAVYRIDEGQRIDVQSDMLNLAQLGLPIYQENLANASGGLVRIPGYRIRGARQVQIELNRGGRIYTRSLARLEETLIAAHHEGCKNVGVL